VNLVRLRHTVTGATYDAPETAVAQYRTAGWVRDDEIQLDITDDGAGVSATPPALAPDQNDTKSPRGRRTSKED
jgi:hypothetical protein